MSDPAIEAAQRALVATRGHGNSTICEIAAAREALKPIRELHTPKAALFAGVACAECRNEWPCDTAKLIYTTEELES